MTWPPSAAGWVALIAMLVGLVMLMSGRGGVRTGQQIGLVIVAFLILMGLFALVVNRAL